MVGARITLERLEVDAEIVEKKKGIPREVSKVVLETVIEDRQNHKRQPPPEPPEGGISIRAAGRKYKIVPKTISRWVTKGFIPILLRTKNELYIDEKALKVLVGKYQQAPGRGKRTILIEN